MCDVTIESVLRLSAPAFVVGLLLLVALGFSFVPRVQAQEEAFEIPSVAIAGGDLAQSVELAPADADAFRRRVNQLPRLDDPPNVEGEPYRVTSSYWPVAVRLEDDEDVFDVEVLADYYPDGGFVRTTVGGEDVWAVLNLRQRVILDRYIRLAEGGHIGETPSTMDVLAADIAPQETFGVSAGPNVFEYTTGIELVSTLSALNPAPFVEPRQPPEATDEGFWLIVTLLEGHTLRYYYDGAFLTESLGTERYDAAGVSQLLEGVAPATIPVIVHEEPAGSLLWWPLAIGGAVVSLGVAVWLRRRGAGALG